MRVASRSGRIPTTSGPNGRVEAVAADLRDEDQGRRAVAGAEAVVDLVGIGRERGQGFEAVHVDGAARVARLAAAAGVVRLVHVSALGVAEDAPSAADRTKAGGEGAVRAAFPSATIVRPSLVYGPGDHFFARFAALARVSPVLPVIGGGRTLFQPMHVEDAAENLGLVLERPDTAGTTLALVGPETFTFRELLERMLEVMGLRRAIASTDAVPGAMLGRTRRKVRPMSQTPSPAGPVDLEALDRFLMSDASPEDCMQLSDLDGFLTGIAIGPEPVLPSEWLPVVWGGEEPVFDDAEQARTVIGLIMTRYNEILRVLDTDPGAYAPIFWEGPDGELIAADWAEGFADAVRLRPEAWRPLLEDRLASVLLTPIMVLCDEPEDGSPLDPEVRAALQDEAADGIPVCVAGIHAFWKSRRGRPAAAAGRARSAQGRSQRPVPLRLRSQVQALLRRELNGRRWRRDHRAQVRPGREVGWRGNIPDGRTPGSRPSSPAAAALRRHTAIVCRCRSGSPGRWPRPRGGCRRRR